MPRLLIRSITWIAGPHGGDYMSIDGRHRITRSEAYEGPRGGVLRMWDLLRKDSRGEWVVYDSSPTLSHAKRMIERGDA